MPSRPAARPAARRKPARNAYHHGDLRQSMLTAALQLLAEQGLEHFTLRECARRAGVSHGAPAHHFGDMRGLLSALAAGGFDALVQNMRAHEAAAPADAYSQLVANGQAYVDFALRHRAWFQLMFRSDRLDASHEPLMAAGHAAFAALQAHIAAVSPRASPAVQSQRTALAWAMVHGAATLMIENSEFGAFAPGDTPAASAKLVAEMLQLARPAFDDAAATAPAAPSSRRGHPFPAGARITRRQRQTRGGPTR